MRRRPRRAPAILILLPLLAGCAALPRPAAVLPPPAQAALKAIEIPEIALRLSLPADWRPAPAGPGERLWVGPAVDESRRPEFRLVVSSDFKRGLAELAGVVARLHGLVDPPPAAPVTLAGQPGFFTAALKARDQRQVAIYDWQANDHTYLLIASWVAPEDGAIIQQMVQALAKME
jgi:hypothetical protein